MFEAGSTQDAVVRLEGVSLCYRLAKQRVPSLKEYAIHWMRGSLDYEKLWALRDVDLRVSRGERLGIVGRNGAGKSTLLKVISGVLTPSRGSVRTQGTIAPILELGTGFDYELTGLENIYLNALLLGRTRREIEKQLGGIVDFSGLGDFIRAPIRNYSSGMLARLGFSIATAWVPDLLILDEVLAVGDARFVQRCEAKLREIRKQGTSILLVSHDLRAVAEHSDRVLWLDGGHVREEGAPDVVIPSYSREAIS
jgi:ABC-2 type transport system ATP-binding protein/lipopolysaccharide transport system ATP-binding protein